MRPYDAMQCKLFHKHLENSAQDNTIYCQRRVHTDQKQCRGERGRRTVQHVADSTVQLAARSKMFDDGC